MVIIGLRRVTVPAGLVSMIGAPHPVVLVPGGLATRLLPAGVKADSPAGSRPPAVPVAPGLLGESLVNDGTGPGAYTVALATLSWTVIAPRWWVRGPVSRSLYGCSVLMLVRLTWPEAGYREPVVRRSI
jgi:hypothetical protein